MGSSPGFVSNPCDCGILAYAHALFRLAFAAAPSVTLLALPQRLTRRLILQKARRQAWRRAAGFHRRTDPPLALRLLVG
jgi:hypothetical protein